MVSVGLRQGCRLVLLSVPATNGARCACKCQKNLCTCRRENNGPVTGACFVMKIYFCTMFFVSSFVLLLSCTQKGEGEFGMGSGRALSLLCRLLIFGKSQRGELPLPRASALPGRCGFFPVPAQKLARLLPGLIGFTLSNSCWGFSCASASLIELIGICTNDSEEEQPSSQRSVTLTC